MSVAKLTLSEANNVPEDKMNGNDLHDTSTRIATLSQRTANLENVVSDIRRELGTSISAVNSAVLNMSSKFDEKFAAMTTQMAERNRPQWQALSVVLATLVVIGGLVYWPIRESQSDLKSALQMVSANMVPREELDWRSDRAREDRARTEANITDIRDKTVPRNEWMERNLSRDHDIDNLRGAVMRETTNLQRQVDEVKQVQGNIYNARDVILDMRGRLDRLEGERAEWLRQSAPANRMVQ